MALLVDAAAGRQGACSAHVDVRREQHSVGARILKNREDLSGWQVLADPPLASMLSHA